MNPIVATWVGMAIFGFFLSAWLTWDSWQDLKALGDRGNGRRRAARSRFIREGLRMSVHEVYFFIGVPFIMVDSVTLTQTVTGLMWGSLVLITNSFVDAATRGLMFQTRGMEPTIDRPHGRRAEDS